MWVEMSTSSSTSPGRNSSPKVSEPSSSVASMHTSYSPSGSASSRACSRQNPHRSSQ